MCYNVSMKIKKWIENNSEENYKEFSEKLVKTKFDIVGIRVGKLRKYAKELLLEYGIEALSMLSDNTYEEVMLQGFIVAYYNTSLEGKKKLINNYLHKCDCWSLIDGFASTLKLKGKDYDSGWKMLEDYKNNQLLLQQNPYIERFVLCLSMNLYLNDQYINDVLKYCENLTNRDYTVKMANAWLLATAAIKYFDEVINVIIKMDEETLRYFKGKIRDSYRISKDKKERVKKICLKK